MKVEATNAGEVNYSYGTSGLQGLNPYNKPPRDLVKEIDILVKALGTMVLIPDIKQDPLHIGQIINMGSIQKPILEGDNRKIVEDKLIELIKAI